MYDRSVTREVGEWDLLRDAFDYQHCERVCVGIARFVVVVLDELRRCIPQKIPMRHCSLGCFVSRFFHDLRHSEVTNLRFALASIWSVRSPSDVNVEFTSEDISTFFCAHLADRLPQEGGIKNSRI
jgi:hypothetical protein